jgi:hypothetical protein
MTTGIWLILVTSYNWKWVENQIKYRRKNNNTLMEDWRRRDICSKEFEQEKTTTGTTDVEKDGIVS